MTRSPRAGGYRVTEGFVSPLDLVDIGLLTTEEGPEQLHAIETAATALQAPTIRRISVRSAQNDPPHSPPPLDTSPPDLGRANAVAAEIRARPDRPHLTDRSREQIAAILGCAVEGVDPGSSTRAPPLRGPGVQARRLSPRSAIALATTTTRLCTTAGRTSPPASGSTPRLCSTLSTRLCWIAASIPARWSVIVLVSLTNDARGIVGPT